MTAVMEPTGSDASEVGDRGLVQGASGVTAARRTYIDLVERYRPRVLEAALRHRGGFPLVALDTLAIPEDLTAADSGRIADAISEAMLVLVSEGSIALTVDQKLVPASR